MSDAIRSSSAGRSPLRKSGPPERPACPACERSMDVKSVTPTLFASDFDDVVYVCERCGTEAKRNVKRK